jgi:hypothetical protein
MPDTPDDPAVARGKELARTRRVILFFVVFTIVVLVIFIYFLP